MSPLSRSSRRPCLRFASATPRLSLGIGRHQTCWSAFDGVNFWSKCRPPSVVGANRVLKLLDQVGSLDVWIGAQVQLDIVLRSDSWAARCEEDNCHASEGDGRAN